MQRAAQGKPVSNAEIIKVGRALKNEFSMDVIPYSDLQALCKFFGVNTLGPRSYLQFQLERKLRKLHEDDAMIAAEGIDNLTNEELVQACFLRGMKVKGRTREQMEKQLEDWMELADSEEVPPFLLLLSRSFDLTRDESQAAQEAITRLVKSDRIEELLDRLPDEADLMERKIHEQKQVMSAKSSDLSALFKAVDQDGDGRISVEELSEMMYRLDEPISEAELKEALARVDADKDGRIVFQEFIAVMRDADQKEQSALGSALSKELLRMKKEMRELKEKEEDVPEVEGAHMVSAKIDKMLTELNKSVGGQVRLEGEPSKNDWKSEGAAKKKD